MLLCELKPGQFGKVIKINGQSPIISRLTEIGFTKGATTECLMRSPFSEPTAYLICGTAVALRETDSKNIVIERVI